MEGRPERNDHGLVISQPCVGQKQLALEAQIAHVLRPFDFVFVVVAIPLADILCSPHRQQIPPVIAGFLLLRVLQIKARARHDVVDVPAVARIVLPAHPLLEIPLEVVVEFFDRAPHKLRCSQ